MHSSDDTDHGPTLTLARNPLGAVTQCPCGVLTLTLPSISVRFEPDAFQALLGLLVATATRLNASRAAALQADADDRAMH